ncbi:MAG: hypothetical protein K6G23_05535, partial [Lachnospiraceae bacterium]|nr:hypothetical protein [Lachnospiraceae bacterium]
MKKNMKRTVLGLAGLLCSLLFCGCGRQDDPVPSKLRVVAYVNQMCDEKVECIDVEKCEEPHEVIYTYRSKERDLEFEVISYRSPVYIMIDTEPLYYKKAIRTDYDIQVNNFYRERISALFEEFTDSGYDGLMLCSTSEVHSFAEAMQSANEIYREEISYNGKEYLESHSYGSIRTVVKASEGYENDTVGLGYYTIDGSETSAETYEESLRESILQKLRDGK